MIKTGAAESRVFPSASAQGLSLSNGFRPRTFGHCFGFRISDFEFPSLRLGLVQIVDLDHPYPRAAVFSGQDGGKGAQRQRNVNT